MTQFLPNLQLWTIKNLVPKEKILCRKIRSDFKLSHNCKSLLRFFINFSFGWFFKFLLLVNRLFLKDDNYFVKNKEKNWSKHFCPGIFVKFLCIRKCGTQIQPKYLNRNNDLKVKNYTHQKTTSQEQQIETPITSSQMWCRRLTWFFNFNFDFNWKIN